MKRRLAILAIAALSLGAFTAPASATSAGPVGGALDPRLIGAWVNEKMISSGGASFASFTTVRTMRFEASGRVTQWVQSVGGGQSWSYNGGGRRLEFAGRWFARDGVILVQPDGRADYVEAGRYRFSSPYLVTESREGRLIWQRG
ncbi:MAG: hypothetical protein KAY46_08880 [Burkholderiaceae bacterium]|nr:hypothetical protein [Burkholderiaceae bacterium]